MIALPFRSVALSALCLGAITGCASRQVPASPPPTSAASTQSDEAPIAVVTRSLDTDPPVPGAAVEGWPGLSPKDEAAPGSPAHDHGAHHGH